MSIPPAPSRPESLEHVSSLRGRIGLALYGHQAHDMLDRQIKDLSLFRQNHADIEHGIAETPAYTVPSEKLAQEAFLFYQCDPVIAAKAAHLKNEHKDAFFLRNTVTVAGKPDDVFVLIWNVKNQNYDCYEEILTERDPETGFQGAAFYDHTGQRLVFAMGGTDPKNKKDVFRSGGQTIAGFVDDRMTKVIPFTRNALENIRERHPDILDEAAIDIAGHSVGAKALGIAKYTIEKLTGKKIRNQHVMEPFGAQEAYHHVSRLIAKHEGKNDFVSFRELTEGARTFKGEGSITAKKYPTIMQWLSELTATIGELSIVGLSEKGAVKSHLGTSLVEGFMQEALMFTRKPAPIDQKSASAAHTTNRMV